MESLVTFTGQQRNLSPIDRLEGFWPGRHSMYQRVKAGGAADRNNKDLEE